MIVARRGRMSNRLLPVLLLLLGPSCTASTPAENGPPETLDSPASGTYLGPAAPSPLDPCVYGMPVQVHGWTVNTPVPCVPLWVDKGDPPPERVEARDLNEQTFVAPLTRTPPAPVASARSHTDR